jgi:4'-phosphopantetheinyl transferase
VDLNTAKAIDATVLSLHEQERAQKIKNPAAKALYSVAHVRLREVLGECMNISPSDVTYDIGWNGKPRIKNPEGPHFSLSHSGKRAVIAVSQTAPLGVDIEEIRLRRMDRQTAARFFSIHEVTKLQGLSDTEHRLAFTRLWTFKEAFIKATGEGLARRLDSFGIDTNTLRLISGENPNDWQLADVDMPPQYVGALVAQTRLPLRVTIHEAQSIRKQHIAHYQKLMRRESDSNNTIGCVSPACAI